MFDNSDDDENQKKKPEPDHSDKVRVALEKIQMAFGALKYPGEKAIKGGSLNLPQFRGHPEQPGAAV